MVTWGSNTVHNLGSSTPAPAPGGGGGGGGFNFGSTPAPAPGSGFGTAASSGSAFSFGNQPTPAPGGGGAFSFGASQSSTPAPSFGAPSPSGFGTSFLGSSSTNTPAPGGSIFGAPTNAPGSSIFGSPQGSLFGSTSAFGNQQQQQQQQQPPQIPAQAALQAHQEAMNRAETEKIKAELGKLHAVYTGTSTPTSSSPDSKRKSSNFVTIVYNDITQEHREKQWLYGTPSAGQIMPIAPEKPPQVSEEEWNRAVVENPDPMNYMPVILVGAEALTARVSWQQERAKQLAQAAESIKSSNETATKLFNQARMRLEDIKRQHTNHRKRLLNVMRKVEVVRCMNQPLQPDEVRAMKQLQALDKQVEDARHLLAYLENRSRAARSDFRLSGGKDVVIPDREKLAEILNQHHEDLKKLTLVMSKDARDVDLLKDHLGPPSLR